jgi:hypothetical protein
MRAGVRVMAAIGVTARAAGTRVLVQAAADPRGTDQAGAATKEAVQAPGTRVDDLLPILRGETKGSRRAGIVTNGHLARAADTRATASEVVVAASSGRNARGAVLPLALTARFGAVWPEAAAGIEAAIPRFAAVPGGAAPLAIEDGPEVDARGATTTPKPVPAERVAHRS